MITWLKEFHEAMKQCERIDRRLPLFAGSLLLGMVIGSSIDEPFPVVCSALAAAVAVFNIYVGVFSGRYVQ